MRVQSSYQHPNDLEGLDLQPVESAVSPSQPQVQSSVTLPQWFTPQGRRRRGWSRALRWGLFWVGVAGIISSSGGLAVLWLFHTPASQCYALSALAAPGRRLFCAQQGADSGDTEQLLVALETVAEVIAHPTLAPEAQRLLREWSQKGIAIAQTKIHQGRLEAGIAIAQRIPLESPLYPDAQAAIAIWEAEWQAGTKIIHQFNTALDAQAWERATQLFLALAEFDSDYWRITRADELMFQLSQAKTAKQRQEDVASFLTAELSPQQERLISALVEIKQPQTARRVATAGWESAILDLMQGLWDKQQFGALQQVAKVIQPDSEIYVEAQDWLLLVQATELAAQGTVQSLADAIASAKL